MMFKAILFIFFLTICLFSQGKSDTSKIVATVGDKYISLDEYLARYEDYLIWTGLKDNQQARYSILNNMINEIVLKNLDDNSKIYSNPEYIKEVEWAKKEAILAFLKDREIYAKITASDDELRRAYVYSKTKIAARHLYAATEKEAENLYQLLKMGVSFEELAKQCFTDSILKNNGGYLGYINWGETDPNFENAAYSLKVGEISKPVKTAQGYSIIKVEDLVQDPFKTEDEFLRMKTKLERAVRISKKPSSEEAYLEQSFDKSKINFNENGLNIVLNDLQRASRNTDVESRKVIKECVTFRNKSWSVSDIEKKLAEVPQYNLGLLTDTKKLKQAVLGLLIQEVLLDTARKKGYDTCSYVQESFSKLSNNIYLAYKRDEILKVVPVADSEVVKYYNDNIGFYNKERELNLQEIIVDNQPLANELRKRIENGEDFGTLAEKYSLRKWSAKNKGVMGYSVISNFGDMKDTLWNSPVGKVFGPIGFEKYFGIFKVLGKKEGEPIDINLVKPEITNAIKNEKGFPYMKRHIEELSKKIIIKINDNLIQNYNINLAG